MFWLENQKGMRLALSEWGAAWLSCQIPMPDGSLREVVLGTNDPQKMSQGGAYIGSSIGRYCGRIADARFVLDGEAFLLESNEAPNQLHGGSEGLSRHPWRVLQQTENMIEFAITSPDGECGFPGTMLVQVRYQLDDENRLTITYQAQCDKPSIVNLCNHAYFNLNGEGNPALTQQLQINAPAYMSVGVDGIPLTDRVAVAETPFDFRQLREIGEGIYDHSFWCASDSDYAAILQSQRGDLTLYIATNQPAIHLYTGQGLAGEPNRYGQLYDACAGIALETQAPPDSANHHQDLVRISPSEPYVRTTTYTFVTAVPEAVPDAETL